MPCGARLLAALPGTALCCRSREPFVQRCRPARESVYAGLGLRAQAQAGATVGSSRRIVPGGVCKRSFGSVFWCFAFRARGETTSPHARRPGTVGRGRGPWGLGMTARRRCRVAPPIGRTTADTADAGACLLGISMSESKRNHVRRTSPWTNHALAFAQPGTRLVHPPRSRWRCIGASFWFWYPLKSWFRRQAATGKEFARICDKFFSQKITFS